MKSEMRACYLTNRRIDEKRNESGNHRVSNWTSRVRIMAKFSSGDPMWALEQCCMARRKARVLVSLVAVLARGWRSRAVLGHDAKGLLVA